MSNALKYQAIKNGQVDVIPIFTTDALADVSNITILQDNKHFYPNYAAGMVVRDSTLEKHPQLKEVFKLLTNSISTKEMRHLNYLVEVEKQSPAQVAKQFAQSKGWIS